jgi:hypothetical protein
MAEPAGVPLYRRVLGPTWDRLPEPVRALHDLSEPRRFEGRAEVRRGRGLLVGLVAALFGFPRAGTDVPVTVDLTPVAGREVWRRTFAGRSFRSVQRQSGTPGVIAERFGPFVFRLGLVLDGGRLRLEPRGWSMLGLPLPAGLSPFGDSHEGAEDGRFRFHVEIRLPVIGLVVSYRGWLEPAEARAAAE